MGFPYLLHQFDSMVFLYEEINPQLQFEGAI